MNYLITGIAGAGKSTVGSLLFSYGYDVIELDQPQLTSWVDAITLQVAAYNHGDGEARLTQLLRYVNETQLMPLLQQVSVNPRFYCGYADNLQDFYNYFTKIFLLTIDVATITQRLATRTTGNWGKDPAEVSHALNHVESFQSQMLSLGAEPINSTLPVESIANQIAIQCTQSPPS
jgi:hypothetical protein